MAEVLVKKSSWWKKMLTVIGVLFVIFCIFIGDGVGINNRFYKLLVVTSGSMSPVFEAGDLIFIMRMDPLKAKIGDIVTFQTENGLLTHRIVDIKADGEIITKGDANNEIDSWLNNWKLGNVSTKYLFKIPKIGYFISWWQGVVRGGTTGADYKDGTLIENNEIGALPEKSP